MSGPLNFKKTLLFASVLLLSSCENFDLFQSEDDLNKKIQARWTLVLLPASNPKEFWTFNNGVVYRETMASPTRYDTGTYTLKTTLDDATLDIKGFKDTLSKLVAQWDIVRLDDNILFIATDKNGDPGVTQREFYR